MNRVPTYRIEEHRSDGQVDLLVEGVSRTSALATFARLVVDDATAERLYPTGRMRLVVLQDLENRSAVGS